MLNNANEVLMLASTYTNYDERENNGKNNKKLEDEEDNCYEYNTLL